MRLDKFLCECNIGTRSEVKKIIKTGKVLVNGEGIKQADYKIDENTDEVKYNGEILKYETNVYFLLNKPAGYVTAKKDNLYKTVMELIPQEFRKKCSPVGRLDLDTEGLLLITDDGALNHRLMSPAHHVEKTYYARLDKKIEDEADYFAANLLLPSFLKFVKTTPSISSSPLNVSATLTAS